MARTMPRVDEPLLTVTPAPGVKTEAAAASCWRLEARQELAVAAAPEIVAIVDRTDHASGTNLYFRTAKNQARA